MFRHEMGHVDTMNGPASAAGIPHRQWLALSPLVATLAIALLGGFPGHRTEMALALIGRTARVFLV
jgi:hypothetical protein